MSENTQIEKRKLPSLNDLISEESKELIFKRDSLNWLLNQNPPKQWIKKNPFVKVEVLNDKGEKVKQESEYIPVERVKLTLTQIFGGYRPTIKSVQQIFNSVVVTVTVSVKDPLTGELLEADGIGAVGVQTDKGATASDMGAIKQDAVTKAAPAAYSYAIKNAAENFGKIFGAGMQKYDLAAFTPFYNQELKEQLSKQLTEKFTNGK